MSAIERGPSIGLPPREQDRRLQALFFISMVTTKVHHMVMNSWEKFKETNAEIVQNAKESDRLAELRGEKRGTAHWHRI